MTTNRSRDSLYSSAKVIMESKRTRQRLYGIYFLTAKGVATAIEGVRIEQETLQMDLIVCKEKDFTREGNNFTISNDLGKYISLSKEYIYCIYINDEDITSMLFSPSNSPMPLIER